MRIGIDSAGAQVVYPDKDQFRDAASAEHCSTEDGCITCGDVALPLEVLELDATRGLALCRDERDRRETVEIALVLPVETGDQLLVHAGTAISHLSRNDTTSSDPDVSPRTPGREAEDVRDVSAEPASSASPQGAARGDAVGEGAA